MDRGSVDYNPFDCKESDKTEQLILFVSSSILAWGISWTEDPGGLQSIGSQRVNTTEWLNHSNQNVNDRGLLDMTPKLLVTPPENR